MTRPESASNQNNNAPSAVVRAPTYLTQKGFNVLSAELKNWLDVERPKIVEVVAWAASNGDRSENGDYLYGKKKLRDIDRRINFLTRLLRSAKVVNPAAQTQRETVFFGATVKVINEIGEEKTLRIVGPEEANPTIGAINYQTPLARALLKKKVGDEVRVALPDGDTVLDILDINYEY